MKVRCVTTGHDATGKAVFVSDVEVNGATLDHLPGAEYHKLWGADAPPTFPDGGTQPQYQGYFPPLGGYRFRMFTVAPRPTPGQAPIDRPALLGEMEEKFPGLGEHMEPDNPGMHTTDTIDFEYIISGEVWLELDDGAAVLLRAGDTVVQNGTRHAWRNKGSEPCRVVVFMLGVPRQPSGRDMARRPA